MKKLHPAILILLFSIVTIFSAPVEFQAVIDSIAQDGEATVLTVSITPGFQAEIRVTGLTEIKDESGLPSSIDVLEPGQTVEIKALFTEMWLLALEIKVRDMNQDFELKGTILEILENSIIVQGFEFQVRESTLIMGSNGSILELGDLEVGQGVKVDGFFEEDQLIARRIKLIKTYHDYSRISFEGFVTAIESEDPFQFWVTIEGDVETLVEVTDETDVKGDIIPGAYVRVTGYINSELFVTALRVRVRCLIELSPRELKLEPDESAPVNVVLRTMLENDLELTLASENPDVAEPVPAQLIIPAGEMSATFDVQAYQLEGKTRIMVMLPEEYGECIAYLKVEVGDGDPSDQEKELEVKWTPRVIKAVPQGSKYVDIHLKYGPVDEDVTVEISQVEGDEGLVEFPESVVIPAGMTHIRFVLEFTGKGGSAVLEAKLPDEWGGGTDQIKIELVPQPKKVSLRWNPNQIKVKPDTEFEVELTLTEPAEQELEIALVLKQGDADLVEGIPASVVFSPGEKEKTLSLKSGDEFGKVQVRAIAPLEVGGKHADLTIQVKK